MSNRALKLAAIIAAVYCAGHREAPAPPRGSLILTVVPINDGRWVASKSRPFLERMHGSPIIDDGRVESSHVRSRFFGRNAIYTGTIVLTFTTTGAGTKVFINTDNLLRAFRAADPMQPMNVEQHMQLRLDFASRYKAHLIQACERRETPCRVE